jgi:hypothetical protein
MNERLFLLALEGKEVLGFDTGLDPKSFAQAKLSQLITAQGIVVGPGGDLKSWHAEGVEEHGGSMVIWGDAFRGESLDVLAEGEPQDALNALRRWISARLALPGLENHPRPIPAGALISADGRVFFPPDQLVLRVLNASKARETALDRWLHPDLSGGESDSYTAAAVLYRILSGEAPFKGIDADSLRSDIRDGFYVPPRLAIPGVSPDLASFMEKALAPIPAEPGTPRKARKGKAERKQEAVKRPELRELKELLGPPSASGQSSGIEKFVRPMEGTESEALTVERARWEKSHGMTMGTKRFIRRNTTILTVVLALAVGGALVARSIVQERASRPTTAGMIPTQVMETYYNAFGSLDHMLMEACVIGKAGKGDIDSAMNLFVISKVREAYEQKKTVYSAEEWIKAGSPVIDATIYGVSGLKLVGVETDQTDGKVEYDAEYVFWYPADRSMEDIKALEASAEPIKPLPPASLSRTDRVRLELIKGRWRISSIAREEDEP